MSWERSVPIALSGGCSPRRFLQSCEISLLGQAALASGKSLILFVKSECLGIFPKMEYLLLFPKARISAQACATAIFFAESGESMTDEHDIICPFYGVSEDLCDVGCGYISPSDVAQIIRYCRAHHEECVKYQQLSARGGDHSASTRPKAHVTNPGLQRAARVMTPVSELTTPVDGVKAPTLAGTTCLTADATARETIAPSPLGLLSSGMAFVLLGLQQAGLLPFDTMMVAMGLFYGGLTSVIAGILEWRRNHTFTATAFCAYGLFWLTLVGMHALPSAGIGDAPSALAMGSYLTLWGLFSAVLFFGALQQGRMLSLVFANVTLFLALFALSEASAQPLFYVLAGWQGVLTGVLAVYAGCALLLNDVYRRPIFPV